MITRNLISCKKSKKVKQISTKTSSKTKTQIKNTQKNENFSFLYNKLAKKVKVHNFFLFFIVSHSTHGKKSGLSGSKTRLFHGVYAGLNTVFLTIVTLHFLGFCLCLFKKLKAARFETV